MGNVYTVRKIDNVARSMPLVGRYKSRKGANRAVDATLAAGFAVECAYTETSNGIHVRMTWYTDGTSEQHTSYPKAPYMGRV